MKIFDKVDKASQIANFTKPRYKWASSIYDIMRNLNWNPEEVDLSADKKAYKTMLTDAERRMYDLNFARVIKLDSFATNNLMNNLGHYVSDPIVLACLARQAYEESMHSKSYAVQAEDVCEDPDAIYSMHETDEGLAEVNEAVVELYSSLAQEETIENMTLAVAGNIALEGVHFIPSFIAFHILASKTQGSSKMIKFISRDELTSHLPLHANIFKTAKREYSLGADFDERVWDLFYKVAQVEKKWFKYSTEGVMGVTDDICDQYIDYRITKCMKLMGLVDTVSANPLKNMDKFFDFNDIKSNFFETKVDNYAQASLDGWDF